MPIAFPRTPCDSKAQRVMAWRRFVLTWLVMGAGCIATDGLRAEAAQVHQTSQAPDRYEEEWAYHVQRYPARTVASVQVLSFGQQSSEPGAADGEPCAQFRPTAGAVKSWLRQARPVSKVDYLKLPDYSPCFAEGIVHFAGGARGEWTVRSSGQGVLVVARRRHFLLCEACAASLAQRQRPGR